MGRRRSIVAVERRRPGAPAAGRRRLRTSREKVTTTRREEGSSSLAWRERIKKRKERGGGRERGRFRVEGTPPPFLFCFFNDGRTVAADTIFLSSFFFLSLCRFSSLSQNMREAKEQQQLPSQQRRQQQKEPATPRGQQQGARAAPAMTRAPSSPSPSSSPSSPSPPRPPRVSALVPPPPPQPPASSLSSLSPPLFPAQGSAHSNSRKHQQSGRRRTRKARKKSGRRRGETQGRGRRRSLLLLGSKDARPRFPLRRLGGAGPLRRGLGRVAIGDGGVRACVGPRGGAERRRKRQKRCRGRDARRCRRGLPGRRRGTLRSGRDLFRRPRGPERG